MKKRLIILFLLFGTVTVFAKPTKITGIILDKTTKNPVEYAHIVVLNTKYATASNQNGEFILKAPNRKHLMVKISCIGYKTLELKIRDLKGVIYLEKYTFELNEIVINANKPSAQNYIALAFSKIKENYILSDHLLTGYFKEGEYDSDNPIYTAEGIVEAKLPTIGDLYQYKKIRYLDSKMKKVYKNLSKYKLKTKKGGAKRCLKYSIIDPINAVFPSHFENYKYEIKSFENYNGRKIVIISFEDDSRLQVYGLLFIDLETFAFVRLEGNQLHGDGGPFDNWKWKHHKWTEEYKQNDKGMYYLEAGLYVGNWINKRSKHEYEFRSIFITNNINKGKKLSTEGTIITRKQSFFESFKNSDENFLKNIDSLHIDMVEKKLHKGFPKFSRIKKPYRK